MKHNFVYYSKLVVGQRAVKTINNYNVLMNTSLAHSVTVHKKFAAVLFSFMVIRFNSRAHCLVTLLRRAVCTTAMLSVTLVAG